MQGLHTQPASCCQVSRFAPKLEAERNCDRELSQTDFLRFVYLNDLAILNDDMDITVLHSLNSCDDLLDRDVIA